MALRIVSFESRRSSQITSLIQEQGDSPLVAPSMQEVPLRENHEAITFGKKLLAGKIDVVVFTTGVGASALLEILGTLGPLKRALEALSKIPLIARGPKPLQVLNE